MSPCRTANRRGVAPLFERAWISAPMIDQRLHDRRRAPRPPPTSAPSVRSRSPSRRPWRRALSSAFTASRVAGARREHQRRLSGTHGAVRIRSGLQQPIDDRGVAVAGRQRQRGDAVVVGRIDAGAGTDQQGRRVRVFQVGGPVQRRRAIALRRVDIGVLLQQRQNGLRVAALYRVGEQAGIVAGGAKWKRKASRRATARARIASAWPVL